MPVIRRRDHAHKPQQQRTELSREVNKLRRENDSIRTDMRRCLNCDYRLGSQLDSTRLQTATTRRTSHRNGIRRPPGRLTFLLQCFIDFAYLERSTDQKQ